MNVPISFWLTGLGAWFRYQLTPPPSSSSVLCDLWEWGAVQGGVLRGTGPHPASEPAAVHASSQTNNHPGVPPPPLCHPGSRTPRGHSAALHPRKSPHRPGSPHPWRSGHRHGVVQHSRGHHAADDPPASSYGPRPDQLRAPPHPIYPRGARKLTILSILVLPLVSRPASPSLQVHVGSSSCRSRAG